MVDTKLANQPDPQSTRFMDNPKLALLYEAEAAKREM